MTSCIASILYGHSGTCVYVEVVHHSDTGIDGLYEHHYKEIKPFGAVRSEVIVIFCVKLKT